LAGAATGEGGVWAPAACMAMSATIAKPKLRPLLIDMGFPCRTQ
jgi:hypothetical protein